MFLFANLCIVCVVRLIYLLVSLFLEYLMVSSLSNKKIAHCYSAKNTEKKIFYHLIPMNRMNINQCVAKMGNFSWWDPQNWHKLVFCVTQVISRKNLIYIYKPLSKYFNPNTNHIRHTKYDILVMAVLNLNDTLHRFSR